jgi:transcription-repair coupling factor (superfamily II helicase)
MDRLICGDVGFGKTEVAIRAIFKALNDSKQVAFLAPTTILANQHFKTLTDRFKEYPFRVELLSRFLAPKESEEVIKGIRAGSVDVVVGTHKLLSEKINFKDLGLLVIDEEQRFGVSHKEKLKKLQVGVDVLTLSASPIPRTLEMSLTGIKEMSLISTPPVARQPILTYVGAYDNRAVSEAIRRELLREGQVFYVFNRVKGIQTKVLELQELVPQARIGYAHGQMDESLLEKTILDFIDNKFDVLVCTTIIESGIDMPNVNTLIVERSDLLGLGQMHQLRGRVGRSSRKAYAYLFYPENRKLTESAYERLKSISEQTELGAGFRLAMRDLEIRGAGTLLGNSQSGHIAAVGYDLYVQMVADAIQTIKGIKEVEKPKVILDIPLKAFIPTNYIEPEDIRLDVYKRLSALDNKSDKEDFKNELEDRFGPMPKECLNLFDLVDLRIYCLENSIKEISTKQKPNIYRSPTTELKITPLVLLQSKLIRLTRNKLQYTYEDKELRMDLNNLDTYLTNRSKSEIENTLNPLTESLSKKLLIFLQSIAE